MDEEWMPEYDAEEAAEREFQAYKRAKGKSKTEKFTDFGAEWLVPFYENLLPLSNALKNKARDELGDKTLGQAAQIAGGTLGGLADYYLYRHSPTLLMGSKLGLPLVIGKNAGKTEKIAKNLATAVPDITLPNMLQRMIEEDPILGTEELIDDAKASLFAWLAGATNSLTEMHRGKLAIVLRQVVDNFKKTLGERIIKSKQTHDFDASLEPSSSSSSEYPASSSQSDVP